MLQSDTIAMYAGTLAYEKRRRPLLVVSVDEVVVDDVGERGSVPHCLAILGPHLVLVVAADRHEAAMEWIEAIAGVQAGRTPSLSKLHTLKVKTKKKGEERG